MLRSPHSHMLSSDALVDEVINVLSFIIATIAKNVNLFYEM